MEIVLERHLTPATCPCNLPEAGHEDARLDIAVVFTSVECTLAALKHAGALADRLAGRITLLVPQVVPFPIPLTSPPVLIDWNERRFQLIARASPVDITVRIYLCRDGNEVLKKVLGHGSLVVVAERRRRWRFSAERRLVRELRRSGHEVIVIERTE